MRERDRERERESEGERQRGKRETEICRERGKEGGEGDEIRAPDFRSGNALQHTAKYCNTL